MFSAKGATVARSTRVRGAGLGNEIIPLAKSMAVAYKSGLKLLPPCWALNKYDLAKLFGYRRSTLLLQESYLQARRTTTITEEMYRSTGIVDYGLAVEKLMADGDVDCKSTIVNEGMWGGYLCVEPVRVALRNFILRAPGVLNTLVCSEPRGTDARPLRIAVHIRFGDFSETDPRPGTFNSRVPISWYRWVIGRFLAAFPQDSIRIDIYGNCASKDLTELGEILQLSNVTRVQQGPLNDLVSMSMADALVTSISSFSMLAAFLSDNPYIWYKNQLTASGSVGTLWGGEVFQKKEMSPTAIATAASSPAGVHRGVAIGEGDALPGTLLDYLQVILGLKDWRNDLIRYGKAEL